MPELTFGLLKGLGISWPAGRRVTSEE